MISIVLSKSGDKSNTKYYDVVIKNTFAIAINYKTVLITLHNIACI